MYAGICHNVNSKINVRSISSESSLSSLLGGATPILVFLFEVFNHLEYIYYEQVQRYLSMRSLGEARKAAVLGLTTTMILILCVGWMGLVIMMMRMSMVMIMKVMNLITMILTLFVGWTGLKKVIIVFIRVHIKDIFIFHLHPHYNDQVLWAVYGDCDPIAGHQIKKADQLLPLLVLQVSGGKDDR